MVAGRKPEFTPRVQHNLITYLQKQLASNQDEREDLALEPYYMLLLDLALTLFFKKKSAIDSRELDLCRSVDVLRGIIEQSPERNGICE
jgi:hypothetical protein